MYSMFGAKRCAPQMYQRDAVFFFTFYVQLIAAVSIPIAKVFNLTRCRPKWTRPFTEEQKPRSEQLEVNAAKSLGPRSKVILGLVLVGLTARVTSVLCTCWDVIPLLFTVSWIAAALIAGLSRLVTTPFDLLTILTSVLAAHISQLLHAPALPRTEDIPIFIELTTTWSVIVVILQMPLRDPELPTHQIGSRHKQPNSKLRSPEDNLTLWEFMTVTWMSPLLKVGSHRQLDEDDVWDLGFEFKHSHLHMLFRELRGSVTRRLLIANGFDLVIMSFLALLESVANFATPVLLQRILQSMDESNAAHANAIVYAILSLLVRLVASQCAVFNLWFSRRCYERSRGEMILMFTEKILERKNAGVDTRSDDETHPDNPHSERPPKRQPGGWSCILSCRHLLANVKKNIFPSKRGGERVIPPASLGKILNIMRNDVYEVAQRFWEFPSLITGPFGLLFSIVLVWKIIGWPCLLGICTIFVAQGINALFTRALLSFEKRRRRATDDKLQQIYQYIGAIRHLRWYAWENVFVKRVMQARKRELNLRVVTGLWRIMIAFTNTFASGMFPVAAFYAFTVIAGRPLKISIAFPALQLFTMLETSLREIPRLITVLLNANVAVSRMTAFMNEPNKSFLLNESETGNSQDCVSTASMHLQNGAVRTPVTLRKASFAWPGAPVPILDDVCLTFPTGLTVVSGRVGEGKTALLQALLGELDLKSGKAILPETAVGYCAQTPWLQSMSIRENILFFQPLDKIRYERVLEACALSVDLANFQNGDLSEIGENGIGLSGGQKMRVALARAVYSQSAVLVLDDPLSALDHQTADHIVQNCLTGPLVRDRVVILVTHRTELCLDLAKQVVVISKGKARVLRTNMDQPGEAKESDPLTSGFSKTLRVIEDEVVPASQKFMEEEHRAHGSVLMKVYWAYVRAGKFRWWVILLCILPLYRLVAVAETWFLKQWGEAYKLNTQTISVPFSRLPSPDSNIRPWLVGFFLLASAQATMLLISQTFMLVIIYTSGRQMFRDALNRISRAAFRFYDITPVGRLMNRMTSDLGTVDGNISQQFQDVAWLSITWISSLIIIASVTPIFLVFSLPLTALFILVFRRFLPTSQSLRRLEMISLSPLFANLGALLDGLTTVRAFGMQSRFQDRVIAVTDTFQRMDHFYWSLQAWLMYRFDALSACSTLLLTLLALYTRLSPGLTAFLLIAASQFVASVHELCKRYGQLQMDFVSVERVVELLRVEQEHPGSIEPPAWWPSAGDIVFENVTIRYAPQFDPSLTGVSFRIPGGSTTALLGRTGSGKSTLVLALLAINLPESGRIIVDGVDISTVSTQALRSRVTFLAQEPVLFPGSLRQNLDPLDEHCDDACKAVLLRIFNTNQWTLDTRIEAGGHNLSQGQRQLVGLARAVLRRSSLVILDEATASVDMETAMHIQRVLKEELQGSTIIVIAHRLEAVNEANYFVKLGHGRVIGKGLTMAESVDEEGEEMERDSNSTVHCEPE